jgi:TetR/AcrR family transcriptional regulator, regulator of autoinduction and epiphytic fitness
VSIVRVLGVSQTGVVVDGRRARRQQNRHAVLEALGQLYEEGNYSPSTVEIAERAGISPRSLFRYFDDLDDLSRAAIEHQTEQARPLTGVDAGPGQPLDEKAQRLVDQRARLFEAVAPAARAARVCAPRHPVVATQVRQARSMLRAELQHLFEPELSALEPARAAAAMAAADALCSFESWELMRHDQRLSRPRAVQAITQALCDLLDPRRSDR